MANPANSSENPELQAWVDKWSAKYPPTWDKNVQPLAGRPSFGHKEVEAVYQWKFRRLWPQRKIDAMRTLSQNEVISLTGRAFSCADELGALLILTLIPGARTAGASAILMAHDPERYTVMDIRALRSLISLGLWSKGAQGSQASGLRWLDYLHVCRDLAQRTNRSLRTIDRALWAANGHA